MLPVLFTVPKRLSTLRNGLIFYAPLDEASGAALDIVGGRSLTDNATVTSGAGTVGTARQYTAANSEYHNVASDAGLELSGSDFTLQAWVNPDDTGGTTPRGFISKLTSFGANIDYMLWYGIGGFAHVWSMSASNTALSRTDATVTLTSTAGTWYHLLGSFRASDGQLRIRVNNGTPATATLSGTRQVTTVQLLVGTRQTSSNYWNGRMDEVAMWNRLLTSAEEDEAYARGLAGWALL
jgi:hypothetical protein